MSKGEWGPLISEVVEAIWPDLPDGAKWIAAQVKVESDGDPSAKSRDGAVGLLQLMAAAAAEMGVTDRRDPKENLQGGVRYLRKQHDKILQTFEIPQQQDKLAWALAAYNAGRGYIVQALLLAERDALPEWQRWDHSRVYLFHRSCTVQGKYPDYHQVWNYVERVRRAMLVS